MHAHTHTRAHWGLADGEFYRWISSNAAVKYLALLLSKALASWPAAACASRMNWFLPAAVRREGWERCCLPISALSPLHSSSIQQQKLSPDSVFLWHSRLPTNEAQLWIWGYIWKRLRDGRNTRGGKLWAAYDGREPSPYTRHEVCQCVRCRGCRQQPTWAHVVSAKQSMASCLPLRKAQDHEIHRSSFASDKRKHRTLFMEIVWNKTEIGEIDWNPEKCLCVSRHRGSDQNKSYLDGSWHREGGDLTTLPVSWTTSFWRNVRDIVPLAGSGTPEIRAFDAEEHISLKVNVSSDFECGVTSYHCV